MDITGCFVRKVMNTKRVSFLGQPFDYHLVTGSVFMVGKLSTTTVLGSTQPLVKMSTRNIPGG
jgi:hypothetical protein